MLYLYLHSILARTALFSHRWQQIVCHNVVCTTTAVSSIRKRPSPAASHSTTLTNSIIVTDSFSAILRFRPFWEGFSLSVKTPPIKMLAANTSVSLARYSYHGRAQIL